MCADLYELEEHLEKIDGSKKTWNDCLNEIKKYKEEEEAIYKKNIREGNSIILCMLSLLTGSIALMFSYISLKDLSLVTGAKTFLVFFILSSCMLFINMYVNTKNKN